MSFDTSSTTVPNGLLFPCAGYPNFWMRSLRKVRDKEWLCRPESTPAYIDHKILKTLISKIHLIDAGFSSRTRSANPGDSAAILNRKAFRQCESFLASPQ